MTSDLRLSPIEAMTKAYEEALDSKECDELSSLKRRPFAMRAALQALIDYPPTEKMLKAASDADEALFGEFGAINAYLRAALNETE